MLNIAATNGLILPKLWDQDKCYKKLKMKTTFHGRRPQKYKTGISQQPLVRSLALGTKLNVLET